MERDAHHAIRGVESLLNTIAVVDINVDVQHALVVPKRCGWSATNLNTTDESALQQLKDSQHDIVDVAEARRLSLLCMVKATCEANQENGFGTTQGCNVPAQLMAMSDSLLLSFTAPPRGRSLCYVQSGSVPSEPPAEIWQNW